jgi:hypothetical protein
VHGEVLPFLIGVTTIFKTFLQHILENIKSRRALYTMCKKWLRYNRDNAECIYLFIYHFADVSILVFMKINSTATTKFFF